MDGYLKIKTKLDNDGLDPDIQKLENKLKKLQIDANSLSSQKKETEADLSSYEKEEEEYNKLVNKAEEYKNKIKELKNERQGLYSMVNGSPQITDREKFSSLSKEIANAKNEVSELNNKIDESNAKIEKGASKYNSQKTKLQQIDLKLSDNKIKQDEIKAKIEQINEELDEEEGGVRDVNSRVGSLSTSVSGILKKVAKWSLAIFGVRSAYTALSKASSTLSQYNSQYATDLEYIQYVLAMMVKPILTYIVNLVYKLMYYINYISSALFGVNLFANASASAFKSMASSASDINNSLSQSGFDEMNIAQDTSSSSSSSVGTPSFDLSSLEDVEIPQWLKSITEFLKPIVEWFQKIIDKYGPVATGIGVVVAAIAGFYILSSIISLIKGVSGAVAGVSVDFTGFFDSLGKAVEAIAILGGLALVISQVTELIDAFSESGLTVNEVVILLTSIFVVLIGLMASVAALAPLMTAGLLPFSVLIAEICIVLEVMADTIPTILDACGTFIEKTAPQLSQVLTVILSGITDIIYALGTTLPPIVNSVGSLFDSIFNGISNVVSTVGNAIVSVLKESKSTVTTVLSAILSFINQLGSAINTFIDNLITGVTKLINFVVSGMEYLVNSLVVKGINKIISAVNVVPGVNISQISTVSFARFVPKLATGAIINLPGKGVSVGGGSAIGGEAGREGILPLSDSQAMAQLGQEIGKWITINTNNTIKLDSKVISRQTIKQQNQLAFEMGGA